MSKEEQTKYLWQKMCEKKVKTKQQQHAGSEVLRASPEAIVLSKATDL